MTKAGWIARLYDYLTERFPLLSNGLLILSFYSSSQFLAHALSHPGRTMQYDLSTLLGFITMLCFFFHVRVFDDHKDYSTDCQYFPERLLQRGIVTLGELKFAGALAISCEFTLAAICGPAALATLSLAFLFSLLMLKEFFLREWLLERFLLYASVHMLIMPLLALTIWSFATGQYFWQAPFWYWLYSFVTFFLAFNWEISRKIRVPEDEIDGVDSYTRSFGTYGAAYLVLLMRLIDTLLISWIAYHLELNRWFYVLIVALFAVGLVGFFQYRFQTSSRTAKRMEVYAGIYIISFDIALAIAFVNKYGIRFSGTFG